MKSLGIVLPLFGLGFLAFSIPDYLVFGWGLAAAPLFFARVVFFLLAVAAPGLMRSMHTVAKRETVLGLVTTAAIAAFAWAVLSYRDQDIYLQAMSVLLMISAQYLIPNRLSFSIGMSLILVAVGLFGFGSRSEPIPAASESAMTVDFVLMALISSLISLRTCRSRRREYAKAIELEHISKTDQLTGLGNRRFLEERYRDAQARMSRYGESYALILMDLDHFKSLNDEFGHEAGDNALRETARRFNAALRTEDSLSRWGGEEFIALISFATADAALESAKRLRSSLVTMPMQLVGAVRASFGVTLLRLGESLEDTVARADIALYRAKDSGRDKAMLEL